MTPDDLEAEWNKAKASLRKCDCGGPVFMRYDPGVTWLHCLKESKDVLSLPDWQPTEIAREWNKLNLA